MKIPQKMASCFCEENRKSIWLNCGANAKKLVGYAKNRRTRLSDTPVLCILADHEGGDLVHEILAIVGVDLQRDGLGEIQGEDAEDGFAIDDVTADAQVDVVGMTVYNVDEGLYVFCQAELDVDCFHTCYSPHISSVLNTYCAL